MSGKQKKWFTSVFDGENDGPVEKRPRLNKSVGRANPSRPRIDNSPEIRPNVSSSNWLEEFAPRTIDDLAVHIKKIGEIKDWFTTCDGNGMLLVTGPPGCGKTATIRLIANDFNFDIREWIVQSDSDRNYRQDEYNNYGDMETLNAVESQAQKFSDFLYRTSRFASVFSSQRKRLILVDDFPNIFLKDADAFNEVLGGFRRYGKSPLVFVVTNTENRKLDISYNLFGDAVLAEHNISKISFNGASASLLKNCLKRITTMLSASKLSALYKQPSAELFDAIIFTSNGDIRNAVINLQFALQENKSSLAVNVVHTTSKTKDNKKNNKFSSLGCDDAITFMHAVGRVLNPKYMSPRPSNGINTLLHSPEQLAADLLSQPSKFVTLLHTNYVSHFQDIDNVLAAADLMSRCDVYMNEWKDISMSEIGLTLAVRGVMVYNTNPAPGWIPIKANRKCADGESSHIDKMSKFGLSSITSNVWATDYQTHVNIIKK